MLTLQGGCLHMALGGQTGNLAACCSPLAGMSAHEHALQSA